MKKSSFVALILGSIGVMLFALGMCMTLVARWNTFKPGIILGCSGIVLGFVTILIHGRMENKALIQFNTKTVFTVVLGIIGVLALGIGMCFSMMWNKMISGVIIGLFGMAILLSLIPITKGVE